MLLSRLTPNLSTSTVVGIGDPDIIDIAVDVDDVGVGTLFVVTGPPSDAAERIDRAVVRGASAIALAAPTRAGIEPPTVACIVVDDVDRAVSRLSAALWGDPSARLGVIGVTGTDGKTTTCHLVDATLRAAGFRTAAMTTIGVLDGGRERSVGSRLTTPEAPELQRRLRTWADAGVEWVTVEATSQGLALQRVADVRFDVGVLTNVTHEHLDFHGSLEAYRRAKRSLLEQAHEWCGTAVVDVADSGACATLGDHAERAGPVVRCGDTPDVDVMTTTLAVEPDRARFLLETPIGSAEIRLPLPGEYNVSNARCAAGAGVAVGLPFDRIVSGLEAPIELRGRMQAIDVGQPFSVHVDFAHTPAAVERMLTDVRRTALVHSRVIVVIGSAGQRDVVKRSWMGHICMRLADHVVFTVEDPRHEPPDRPIEEMAQGAIAAGGVRDETFHCVRDRREAIAVAFETARPGDRVVLCGKGHERSIDWGSHVEPWDEARIAAELLEAQCRR